MIKIECNRCTLSKYRRNIVIGRGDIPAEILFIGEAPGRSENLRGIPFCGTSGRILNKALSIASARSSSLCEELTYYITNTVLCRPCNGKAEPNRQPTMEERLLCKSNIIKIHKHVQPYRLILLGKVAKATYTSVFPGSYSLVHPAYIARQGGINSSHFRDFVLELKQIFKEIHNGI